MTVAVRDSVRRLSTPALVTIGLGIVAWLALLVWLAEMNMGSEPGTLGLGLVAFVSMWTLMMAAMMLPAVAPLVGLYARSVGYRPNRLVAFGVGYVGAWGLTGIAAFLIAKLFREVADNAPTAAHLVGVGGLLMCAVYQLTPLKRWCLRHCRSPIGHLLHYSGYTGSTRDLRAGGHHGLVCIGCCWLLMVGLIIVGIMNVVVMLTLAGVIALEKHWRHGERLAQVVGAAALVMAIAVAFDGSLAAGLWTDDSVPMSDMGEM